MSGRAAHVAESGGGERRGTVLGIALVVAMAAGVLALGLSGAFPDQPCVASAPPPSYTVRVDRPLPGPPDPPIMYRLAPTPFSRADVDRFASALGLGPVTETSNGWSAGDRSQVGFLSLVRTAVGWSIDLQPASAAQAPFAARSEHPGSRTTARRAALEALAVFGVDARNWATEVGPIEDSADPVRYVTLTPMLDGVRVDDLALEVEIWNDGSVSGLDGLITKPTAVPVALTAPAAVLHRSTRPGADPYGTSEISIPVDETGHRPALARPSPTLKTPAADVRELRCAGVVRGYYSMGISGIDVRGVVASRQPKSYRPPIAFTFHVQKVRRAFVVVVREPSSRDASLVPAYSFSGSSNLHFRDGSAAPYVTVEMAVPLARVLAAQESPAIQR